MADGFENRVIISCQLSLRSLNYSLLFGPDFEDLRCSILQLKLLFARITNRFNSVLYQSFLKNSWCIFHNVRTVLSRFSGWELNLLFLNALINSLWGIQRYFLFLVRYSPFTGRFLVDWWWNFCKSRHNV